jgi:glycosyltransferase involved in cell wall biosynthesis
VLQVVEASIGGVKRHLLDLLAGFAERGDVVSEVACPDVRDESHGDTSFAADARALGCAVHVVPMRRRVHPAGDLAATLELARLIRRGGYDLVHLHSSKAGALGRAAVRLARGRRPAVVYTPHGFAFLIPGRPAATRFYAGVERALGRLTDRLIAISEDERREALSRGIVPASKIRLVRSGVDPEALAARAALVNRRDGTTLGTVSAMRPQKDPFTLLRAVARVLAERPDARFVWVMGGELEAQVHAAAGEFPADVRDRIEFLGYRSDAVELIAAMDVFALSSVFEAGLPYVLMEALALERPVVATAGIGSRELIEDGVNGLLVPRGDAGALARGMMRLIDDPELRERLGRAGRELVLEQCTLERQVRETADVYFEAAGSRMRSRRK